MKLIESLFLCFLLFLLVECNPQLYACCPRTFWLHYIKISDTLYYSNTNRILFYDSVYILKAKNYTIIEIDSVYSNCYYNIEDHDYVQEEIKKGSYCYENSR